MKISIVALIALVALLSPTFADQSTSTPPTGGPTSEGKPAPKMITMGKVTLPAPPSKPGCYRYRTNWQEVPCLSEDERRSLPPPQFLMVQEPLGGLLPITEAELDVDFLRFGGVVDSITRNSNDFSLQLNTNHFRGNNGHLDWVQFTYQREKVGDTQLNVACIWTIDTTTSNYNRQGCVRIDVNRPPMSGDKAVVRGTFDFDHLAMILILPGATGGANGAPDVFAVSASDQYGLVTGANWSSVNGGFLGAASSSQARLSQTCLETTFRVYLAPSTQASPGFWTGQGGNTGETSNITLVNTPPPSCSGGVCSVTYDGVSSDWTTQGLNTCFPQDKPPRPLPTGSPQLPFEDDNTQMAFNGENVHVCPGGAVLIGVDGANNRFLCSNAFNLENHAPASLIIDSTTHVTYSDGGKEYAVHVCAKNSVMVGWNKSKNELVCLPLPAGGLITLPGFGNVNIDGPHGTMIPEPKHPTESMHACDRQGSGSPLAMAGLKSDDDILVCMNSAMIPRLP